MSSNVPRAETPGSCYFVVVISSQGIFCVQPMKKFYFAENTDVPLQPWTCNRRIFLNVRRCLFSFLSTNYLAVTARKFCVIGNNISLICLCRFREEWCEAFRFLPLDHGRWLCSGSQCHWQGCCLLILFISPSGRRRIEAVQSRVWGLYSGGMLLDFSTLKMEAICSFEASLDLQPTTWRSSSFW
jgi:hypothetical protein